MPRPILPAVPAPVNVPAWMLGAVVPAGFAGRTVRILPRTAYISVQPGETVRFQVGRSEFGCCFHGGHDEGGFDLRELAPPGALDHAVRIHLASRASRA
jgi:hypothetical protein